MADVSVNSVKPSEVSDEMVALYLLASVATHEGGVSVTIKDGIPLIHGADKKWILENYVDCLKSIIRREVRGV
ncbi:hypothetical protein IC614_07625 [Allosphingosinicella flava]|uniref:Uncharacterized protein n=1 Tax=Allosphingosinicella flava TaxID=2771430 RepID=A0A7T2LLC6_9SPHN|nr:hypothetical protein [Sphingosinicella flava]QPQ54233.1 hypothetical protein IC614_07625 [Sphingosinicella flava]